MKLLFAILATSLFTTLTSCAYIDGRKYQHTLEPTTSPSAGQPTVKQPPAMPKKALNSSVGASKALSPLTH